MKPKRILLLLSGGLDSVTLLHHFHGEGRSIHALLLRYGQNHADHELGWAKYHCRLLGVNFTTKDIGLLEGSKLTGGSGSWVVPARNLAFASHAINYAVANDVDSIVVGCNATDEAGFPDCRESFFKTLNKLASIMELPVEVCAPFLHKQKWEIAAMARDIGVKLETIWTCYQPTEDGPCGKCGSCLKINQAMEELCGR